MNSITNSNRAMTSVDTAIFTYNNGVEEIIECQRPVWDSSTGFIQPEAFLHTGDLIRWKNNGYIECLKADGSHILWWERPTIQNIIKGFYGNGVTVYFKKDGSIVMNHYGDIWWWRWGVPYETVYIDTYESNDPPERCDCCGSYHYGNCDRDYNG